MPSYTIESARSSKNDERFGFETRGKFRCPYSTEKFYMILIVVVFVLGLSAISGFMLSWLEAPEQGLFVALAILVFWVIWAVLCLIPFRLIMFGSEYDYSADDDKMTIWHGVNTMDIFYYNVMSVRYEPLNFFGRQRGFVVTIVTRKSTNVFKVIYCRFDALMKPETTPFTILEERAGLNKPSDPDLVVRHRREHMNEQQLAIEDGMLERPVLRNEKQTAVNIEPHISYVENEDDFMISKGSFHVPHKYELLVGALCIVGCILSIGAFRLVSDALNYSPLMLFSLLTIPVFIGVWRVARRTEYRYEADGREFRITDKKGRADVIYYCDVQAVNYKPLRLLWMQRGYKVDIVTKYRTITYYCLFLANKKYQNTYDLPFHIIEERIDKTGPLSE